MRRVEKGPVNARKGAENSCEATVSVDEVSAGLLATCTGETRGRTMKVERFEGAVLGVGKD